LSWFHFDCTRLASPSVPADILANNTLKFDRSIDCMYATWSVYTQVIKFGNGNQLQPLVSNLVHLFFCAKAV